MSLSSILARRGAELMRWMGRAGSRASSRGPPVEEEAVREGRRARKSVNYALPSLNTYVPPSLLLRTVLIPSPFAARCVDHKTTSPPLQPPPNLASPPSPPPPPPRPLPPRLLPPQAERVENPAARPRRPCRCQCRSVRREEEPTARERSRSLRGRDRELGWSRRRGAGLMAGMGLVRGGGRWRGDLGEGSFMP